MKKSLTKKLFIITSLLLLIFVILSLSFQTLFFEKFYTNKKINTLENEVLKFKGDYSSTFDNEFALSTSLQRFEQLNNAKIAIFKSNGEIKYLPDPKKTGDPTTVKILGEVYNTLYNDDDFRNKISKNTSVESTVLDMPNYNMKYIVAISSLSKSDGYDNIVIAITSFQSITEAGSVFKSFYIYIFAFALVIAIILSAIYVNLISKPLIKLNKTAKEMANLNFSVQCSIDREDEIGILAKTLNFLSLNLDSALSHLKTANEKLLQDIEKEKSLETMRKDFIAGVSHELKTPIALIKGYAEGIKDNIIDDEGKEFYLDVILDESDKMESLVSDMLELSRLESPTFKLVLTEFNIKPLIETTCQKFTSFINSQNIELSLKIFDITVIADKFRTEQVIVNFLTNAIRHTPQNGFIRITLIQTEDSNVTLSIENSGSHISKEELPNIWNKFYKLDKSRNRSLGGTGLGLSIVKNILVLHKSVFGVNNTENGVEFFFTLSLSKNEIKFLDKNHS